MTAMETTTFQSIYETYAGDVYRFARYLTASDDAAADITAETFLRAWTARYVMHRQVRQAGL